MRMQIVDPPCKPICVMLLLSQSLLEAQPVLVHRPLTTSCSTKLEICKSNQVMLIASNLKRYFEAPHDIMVILYGNYAN